MQLKGLPFFDLDLLVVLRRVILLELMVGLLVVR